MLTFGRSITCVGLTQIHLLTFSLLPLVIGGVFYASNGSDYPVGVIDAFHVSYAAQTVTGLNTVLLARLTTWQQVLLFVRSLGECGRALAERACEGGRSIR